MFLPGVERLHEGEENPVLHSAPGVQGADLPVTCRQVHVLVEHDDSLHVRLSDHLLKNGLTGHVAYCVARAVLLCWC